MIELVGGGQAKIIDEIRHIEPIPMDMIIAELSRRFGKNFGNDVDAWSEWYLREYVLDDEGEKKNFELIRKIRTRTEYYIQGLPKK